MKATHQNCRLQARTGPRRTNSTGPWPRGMFSPYNALTIPDYVMLKEIGHGSYGNVWLARSVTGLYRAVKIVWRARFGDPEPYEREFRGLKEFAAISGPGGTLLNVLHVGRNDAAGFFYYVMELADDITTGRQIDPEQYVPKTLDQIRRQAGRLAASQALELGVALASALADLHDRGLVHRDVKPSNIVFAGDVPKFADIGLVRCAIAAEDCPSVVGNTAYMPDDLPGIPSADVFGLGKVLYELITGLGHKDFPCLPSDLATFPDREALLKLNMIVLRACALNPAERFPDARALLEEMQKLQAGKPIRPVKTADRQFAWLRPAAALALASLGASFGTWILSRSIEGRPLSVRAWEARAGESGIRIAGISDGFIDYLPVRGAVGKSADGFHSYDVPGDDGMPPRPTPVTEWHLAAPGVAAPLPICSGACGMLTSVAGAESHPIIAPAYSVVLTQKLLQIHSF